MPFTTTGRHFRLLEPLLLPVFDGGLRVETLRVRHAGTPEMYVRFDAEVRPISMAPLARAFGWPEFQGTLAGTIPDLQMRQGAVTLGGNLEAAVFDGRIVVRDLQLQNPLGRFPRLFANIDVQDLDLELVTSTFSFGMITGRLSGEIRELETFAWMPVAFDALTVVVNPKNAFLKQITVAELKKMWEPAAQGKVMTWNQVNPAWPNQPLKLFGAGADSGTFDYFTEAVNGKSKASRGDFTSSEDASTGAPKFLESAGTPAQSVSSWTTFSKASVEIASKGSATIDYTVKVPEAAEPGGHYAAIFASTQAPDVTGGSGVSIAARVGSLLLVTVSGDIRTSAEVVSFKTDKSVYQAGPINFTASLKNSGNIHFKPKGTIDIKNGSTVQSISFNETGGNVLPNSVRDYVTVLDGNFGFGRYTGTLDVTAQAPNGDSIPLAATVSFWVIPWTTVLIALLILVVLWMILKSGMKSSSTDTSVKKGLK